MPPYAADAHRRPVGRSPAPATADETCLRRLAAARGRLRLRQGDPRRAIDVRAITSSFALPMMELSYQSILEAQARLRGRVHRTPVVTSRHFNALVRAEVWFKCENLQRCGAFKARGAMNAVFSLDDATAARGVVTHSSGNHAAAVALAASERGVPAYIVVPHDTARPKVAAVERAGGRLTFCEPTMAAREAAAARLLEDSGGTLIHPFDNPWVIAGQGTAALELLEERPQLELVMAPVSGGGLLSGSALAAHGINPHLTVLGAEPATMDDAAQSLAAGTLLENSAGATTLADGLRANLSPRTFALLRAHVAQIATVSEAEIVEAMRLFWEIFKLVIEPSSAVPVAALLARRTSLTAGRRVGVIITGGNVDLDALPWTRR